MAFERYSLVMTIVTEGFYKKYFLIGHNHYVIQTIGKNE